MNLSEIDLNLFLVLHVVLEEGSATRAAQRLHVTQSAVSNALGRLRSLLGDPLVVRKGRGLVATPRARALRPELDAMVARLRGLLGPAAEIAPESVERTFTLACPDHHEIAVVPRILAVFRERLPRASLRVVSKDYQLATDGLASGEVDVAFTVKQGVHDKLHHQELFSEGVPLLAARRDHPALRRGLTPELFNSLEHIQVLVPLGRPGHGHRFSEAVFERYGLRRKVVLSVPHFTSAAVLVSRSDRVAWLPRRLVEALAAPLGLRGHPLPAPVREEVTICMAWHARTHDDPASRHFRAVLAQAVLDRPGAPGAARKAGVLDAEPRLSEGRKRRSQGSRRASGKRVGSRTPGRVHLAPPEGEH